MQAMNLNVLRAYGFNDGVPLVYTPEKHGEIVRKATNRVSN